MRAVIKGRRLGAGLAWLASNGSRADGSRSDGMRMGSRGDRAGLGSLGAFCPFVLALWRCATGGALPLSLDLRLFKARWRVWACR